MGLAKTKGVVKKAANTSVRTAAFGDVVACVNCTEADPLEVGLERYVGLEHIEPENLHIKAWGDVADGTSFTKTFRKGQTLFGKRRAYQRKVAYAEFDGICSGDILVFESKDPKVLLPELLPFICQTERFFQYALGTSAGSLSPRTSWGALAKYEFRLPPIEEQRRIAELLWAADDAVECWREAKQKLQCLLSTQLSDIFKDTDYDTVPLGSVGRWVSGGTPSRSRPDYWNGAYPWVSPKDMKTDIIEASEETISETAWQEAATRGPRQELSVKAVW